MPVPHINRFFRTAKRYQEILTVLVNYGFKDVIAETGLDEWVGLKRVLKSDKVKGETASESRAVRLRLALEELGPTFIKLGQVLSTRPDLVPIEWANEFKKLQDDVPSIPFDEIRERLEQELPGKLDTLFTNIEETPLAAASLSQVHRATLASGESAVIKVLRPGTRATIEADMEVLSSIAHFVERHFAELGYSPTEVVHEFSRQLAKEVDLTREGQSTERLQQYFADDERVKFPRVYWDATTPNVLTMEEIRGTRFSHLNVDELTPERRRTIVAIGADAVFRQCLEFGFFHADPHPGNLFLIEGDRVAFIDCGMVGQLDRRTSEQLADLVAGVVTGDLERVIGVSIALTNADPTIAEDRRFRSETNEFIGQFQQAKLERLDMGKLLDEFFLLLRNYRIRCPSDLVFLIKAITTIEGVAVAIDPDFDPSEHVKPYVEDLISNRYGFAAIRHRFHKAIIRYADLIEQLPIDIGYLTNQLRANRFSINLEHRRLDRLTETVEHASRNVAHSLIIAALLIGSSILILASQDDAGGLLMNMGIAGFVLAFMLVVGQFLVNRVGRRPWFRKRESDRRRRRV
jgi:ubiquinone biosynthesis protein